jgi:hypothetical protein
MLKPLASCFDCVFLQYPADIRYKDRMFYCATFHKAMTYDVARTPNDCPRRMPEEQREIGSNEILDQFYEVCCRFAEKLGRPFTMREFFEETSYKNKNSLWDLMESLVQDGRLEKADGSITTWRGQVYKVKIYYPRWRDVDLQEAAG